VLGTTLWGSPAPSFSILYIATRAQSCARCGNDAASARARESVFIRNRNAFEEAENLFYSSKLSGHLLMSSKARSGVSEGACIRDLVCLCVSICVCPSLMPSSGGHPSTLNSFRSQPLPSHSFPPGSSKDREQGGERSEVREKSKGKGRVGAGSGAAGECQRWRHGFVAECEAGRGSEEEDGGEMGEIYTMAWSRRYLSLHFH
jgi:hypothetical protein